MSNLRDFLEEKYQKNLSKTEITEHQKKLTDFFNLLLEIDQIQRSNEKKNEDN